MRSLPVLLLLACTAEAPVKDTEDTVSGTDDTGPAGDTSTDTDPGDSGDPSDPDCAPSDITVEETEIATVFRVRWTTPTESSGYVEFGKEGALTRFTPPTRPGLEHQVLVLGMTADTDVSFRIVDNDNTCDASSDVMVHRTGSLPSGLFPTRVTGRANWNGYQVLPLQGTGYAVVIIDNEGHYVWYHQVENAGNLMRAFLSADGEHVLLCHAGPQSDLSQGKIVKVSLDGAEVTEIPFPFIDHDMVELPDGTISAIVVDPRESGSADAIVELAADGTQTEIFNAWDHFDPDLLGIPEFEHNWTHGNALDYDPVEDAYYLSMKAMGTLAKIDRATGEVLWTMNGYANTFTYADGTPVQMHHQFDVEGNRILFFENGPVDRGYSRAVEVEFDATTMQAEEVWEYTTDPALYVFAKGDVHRFGEDDVQVVWSSAGQIQNVNRDGDVHWQLDLELGQAVTFVHYAPSMYASQW